jgi:hypothetical protein
MIKLSTKSRKLLRKIFQGLGVTTAALAFQACDLLPPAPEYGPPFDRLNDVRLRGTVVNGNVPVPGIKVSVTNAMSIDYTDSNGVFDIYVSKQDSYTLHFEDIDGSENGGSFQKYTQDVSLADTNNSIDITLEENAK